MTAVLEIGSVEEQTAGEGWATRVDRWFESVGDRMNPILVKESRQALKSKQFVTTFSLLLLASFGWSVVGSLILMPRIYFVPSAPTMLLGYYTVLAVPMLLVVPLAAFRSLAAEIDDGTMELLSVSSLSPIQIVLGKLASAMLQLMLYFVALVPCVAYAYALRGTDLPTLFLLLTLTLLMAFQLTVVGLFLAPLTAARSGQLTMLVAFLVVLVTAEFSFGSFAVALISEEWAGAASHAVALVVGAAAMVATTSGVLLTATAAQLTPPSENRSTSVRVALFVQQSVMVLMVAYVAIGAASEVRSAGARAKGEVVAMVPTFGLVSIGLWLVVGAMMASESPVLTPRIRRDLPASFLARMLKTWWMPGPGPGVVFAVVNASVVALVTLSLVQWMEDVGALPQWAINGLATWKNLLLAAIGYLALLLVLVRLVVTFLRRHADVQPAIGVAVLVILSGAMCLIPYGVQLHLNDYRSFPYSWWQLPNWPWTLSTLAEGGVNFPLVPWLVFGTGGSAFLLHVLFLGPAVLPQRLATPRRVQEERERTVDASR